MNDKSVIEKAEIVLVVGDYDTIDIRKKKKMVDFTFSPQKSDDKILVRAIIETTSTSEYIGVDSVRGTSNLLEKQDYDRRVLVGKKITEAARSEMEKDRIEMISDITMLYFKSAKLFSKINEYIQIICKAKCGQIPLKNSDCKRHKDGRYIYDVGVTNDNADFHFERGWTHFLEKDLMKLLEKKHHLMIDNTR